MGQSVAYFLEEFLSDVDSFYGVEVNLDGDVFVLFPPAKGICDGVVRTFNVLEFGADGLYLVEPAVLNTGKCFLVQKPTKGLLVSSDDNSLAMDVGAEGAKGVY